MLSLYWTEARHVVHFSCTYFDLSASTGRLMCAFERASMGLDNAGTAVSFVY
jgi:hypothetical protein